MKNLYKHYVVIIICLLSIGKAYGQDLHYSQFYNSPLNLNPAQTGIFNGDQRFSISLRDQWRYVPVPWTTFSAAYDFKILPDNQKDLFAVGFNFNYDKQGASKLNLSGLNASGSYSRVLNANNIVTAGAILGFSSRGFNLSGLTWDTQWDGAAFDPKAGSGENFDTERVYFLETALGLNYRLQKDERTKVDFGISGFHIYKPKADFYNTETKRLPTSIALSVVGSVKIIDALDIQLQFLRQKQDEYREMVYGGLAKIYLSQQRGKETELHVGMGYRTAKSYIPTVALQYQSWYVGLSYDIDNTELNDVLNSNRGGPEIHVRYIITKVKPMNDRKVCPIY